MTARTLGALVLPRHCLPLGELATWELATWEHGSRDSESEQDSQAGTGAGIDDGGAG